MNLLTFAATLALGAVAWAGGPTKPPAQNPTPVKKATTAATVRKTTPVATTVAKKPVAGAATSSSAAKHVAAKKAPVVRTTWRNRQLSPTADRYREIQEALVARGYLPAEEANGTWGASSSEAMKKFQAEQTLDSTGRIDSLSLIALGLGPRHDSPATATRAVDANNQPEFGRNN